jgi:glutamate synthase (NADPH/NADH) small chain
LTVEDGKLKGHAGKIWVGGDCALGGDDLTVTAVAEGRDAAEAIHAALTAA